MARNVEKSDEPTLLRERLEIRLNKYLYCLFTGVNLDANRRIAKVNLVASSVLSSNDGVRHYDFGIDGCAIILDGALLTSRNVASLRHDQSGDKIPLKNRSRQSPA